MDFKFPDVGEGIHEGVIVKWVVKVGDAIKRDDVLCEVETDKAVVEIPSPQDGVIDKLYHQEGETVHVGETLVSFQSDDNASSVPTEAKSENNNEPEDQGGVVGAIEDADKSKKTYAGPLFDSLKKNETIENEAGALPSLHSLVGQNLNRTRPIDKNDISLAKTKNVKEESSNEYGDLSYEKLSNLRKTIISHLQKAKDDTIPVTQTHFIEITAASELRAEFNELLKERGAKLSYLPFIIFALVQAVKKYPRFNAAWNGDSLVLKKYVNVGIAVDTEDGLMVPVIKDAHKKKLLEIAEEIALYAEHARNRNIRPVDLKGQSITITNYGSLGSVFGTPIINMPDTCILGVGAIQKNLVMNKGKIEEKLLLPLSLTYDHRFNDGADAARFLNEFQQFFSEIRQNITEKDLS